VRRLRICVRERRAARRERVKVWSEDVAALAVRSGELGAKIVDDEVEYVAPQWCYSWLWWRG
jgi:hypothetical protein